MINLSLPISTKILADSPARELLRQGVLRVPKRYGYPDIDLVRPIDWRAFNDVDISLQWWMNTLKFLHPLISTTDRVESDLRLAARIAADWCTQNLHQSPANDFAWNRHAVANRSEYLAALWNFFPGEEWLSFALEVHGNHLSDPENYDGPWNHGLDQNLGLLAVGVALDRADWITLARERISAALPEMVDEEGVCNEQATNYQNYTYLRWKEACARIAAAGEPLSPDLHERIWKMQDLLVHACMPNGELVPLGDSPRRSKDPIEADTPQSLYITSRGQEGFKPESRFGLFKAGYVFGRSGWGEAKQFEEESFYSIRFGPGRIIHGHNDHMSITYFQGGEEVIIDSGFHGYGDTVMRKYLQTPQAHNCPIIEDRQARFRWQSETSLDKKIITEDWQSYLFRDAPYAGWTRRRSILVAQAPFEIMIVADAMVAERGSPWTQNWHISPNFDVRAAGDRVFGTSAKSTFLMQQLYPYDSIGVLSGHTDPPGGWMSPELGKTTQCSVVQTRRYGRNVTYLTVFLFGCDQHSASCRSRRAASGRRIYVSSGGREMTGHLEHSGLLSIEKRWRW